METSSRTTTLKGQAHIDCLKSTGVTTTKTYSKLVAEMGILHWNHRKTRVTYTNYL
jgi:hypothetical protein